MTDRHELQVAGTTLTLYPERAAYWDPSRTLLVADPHLGKDATFRMEGVPIPRGSTESDLDRLSSLVTHTGAQRLVILGDLYHGAAGMNEPVLASIEAWRNRFRDLDVVLVRGNHDRDAGPSPSHLRITEHAGPLVQEPFVFQHRPSDSGKGYVIAGHVHPSITARGPAGEKVRLPCYHVTPSHLTLPALGEFTGTHPVEPAENDQIIAIAEDELVPLHK